MSGIVNKVKEALHHDKSSEAPQGSHGPHDSKAANTADPRVDSDRDHRAATGTTGTGIGSTGTTGTTGTGIGSTGTTGGLGSSGGVPEGTAGHHNSRLANAADPRIDSDLDNSRGATGTHGLSSTTGSGTTGGYGSTTGTTGGLGSSGTTGGLGSTGTTGGYGSSGTTGGYGSSGGVPEGTAGHHNSRVANAADPRIDSDLDNSRGATGTHGLSSTSGTTGTHGTSGLGGSTTGTGALGGSGPGPAEKTAGPHKSDLLNKADPRVDSNLDGSKTVGGDKTYAGTGTGTGAGY